MLKWHVGKRIKEDVLFNQRAEYGKEILKTLSEKLTEKYGAGWGLKSLQHCLRAAYTFSEDEIAYALRIQLSWPFFLARNRIIAGISDAVIVAESKDKGGSLVTASIALDYNRDVFAFPGRVGDSRSEGCNRLIRLNRASLITCAQDFIEAMNWGTSNARQKSIQHSIPFEEENLSSNARLIIDALRDRGDLHLPQLSDATGLDHSTLYEELLDLEMDGKIRSTPGGLYQLR